MPFASQFFLVSVYDKLGKIVPVDARKQCLLFWQRIYAGSACYSSMCHDTGGACYATSNFP